LTYSFILEGKIIHVTQRAKFSWKNLLEDKNENDILEYGLYCTRVPPREHGEAFLRKHRV
jgi:hypothetical protein